VSRYISKGIWGKPRNTICASCRQDKPRTKDHWGPDKRSPDGLSSGWCRRCITRRVKLDAKEARLAAMLYYSDGDPHCACCGEFRLEFLCLDHIAGGGNAHRALISGQKKGGANFWPRLQRMGFPAGFQVLCHNCNMAKHIYGTCPYGSSHVWPHASRKVS